MQYYSKMHIPTTIIWLLSKGQNKTKTRKKTKKEKSIGIIMFWGRRKKEGKTERKKKKIKRLDYQQKNDKTRLRSNSTD